MKLLMAIVNIVFNKKYKIQDSQENNFIYACDGRIIRSFSNDTPKKSYCATYILEGVKK